MSAVPDAEIIQLGSRGPAGRGSKKRPSAAARGLAADRPSSRRRRAAKTAADPEVLLEDDPLLGPVPAPDDDPSDGAELDDPRETVRKTQSEAAPGPVFAETVHSFRDEGDGDQAEAGEQEAGAADEESGAIPPTMDLGAVVAELIDQVSRAVEYLQNLPTEQWGDRWRNLVEDPLRTTLEVAERLGVDWSTSVDQLATFVRARLSGDYAIDEFGFDPQLTEALFLPVMRWLAHNWFRVEVRGAENVPATGSALLVSNHAGTMPLDGMVLHSVVYDELGRHVRMLGADLIFKTAYAGDFARKTGTTLACQEDAERLLAREQLVAVYPEGFKGLGKPYRDRYKLQRFGRGGFVSAAVRAQVPIIPVSVVGSEEIYPLLSTAPALARAMGVPYFPVTPTFPWFGVLGMIPLPSKWIIEFGEAITTDELPPGSADDPMVVFNVTDQVRETIQQTLYALLMQRRSAFF